MIPDLISRSALVADLECLRAAMADPVLRLVLDRVIERVKSRPAAEVHWSRPGPCPLTAEQFLAIYADTEEEVGVYG